MKEKRFTLRALILTALITLALTLGGVALTAWLRLGPGGLAVLRSYTIIQDRFVGDYDSAKLSDSAIHGMVYSLGDRWSAYLDKASYEAWERRAENVYVGIGVTYRAEEDYTAMVILEVVEGGPADQAGIRPGHRLTAVNGQALTADSFDALVASIAGEEGKENTFTVLDETGAARQVTVRNRWVQAPAVTWELREDGIGYIRLKNFYENSAKLAKEAVDRLEEQGAKALLFDVRSNPGGYVAELTSLLDRLLGEGPVFTERSKKGRVKVTWSDARQVELPMAVLINADSYSAAELFAAQLRESAGAILVGERTCGKGYYQQTFPLPGGGALHLSTGMYTTGSGTSLIGTGLTPDEELTDPAGQLDRAVERLSKEMG